MDFSDNSEFPVDLERLIPDAIAKALSDEDPHSLLRWMNNKLPEYVDPAVKQEIPPDMYQPLAVHLGLAIWNALPLPGNNFRPRPLSLPGRNEPCLCGSGRKYKHCCARVPKGPPLDTLDVWPLVLQQLSPSQRRLALDQHKVPPDSLILAALGCNDDQCYDEVLELLEPLFAGSLKKPQPAVAMGLQVLCDAYDELGQAKKKMLLLARISAEAPASPLRAGALQRLTSIHLDQEDTVEARQTFERAMRDAPDDPTLSYLEIQLLAAEERWEQAQLRAHFWLRRLQRSDFTPEEIEPIIDFLEDAKNDPKAALEDFLGPKEDLSADIQELFKWIEIVIRRPLPHYRAVGEADVADEDLNQGLAQHLQDMGVPKQEVLKALNELEEQSFGLTEEGDTGPDSDGDLAAQDDAGQILQPPKALRVLEQDWHAVAGLAKPFGTADLPMDDWQGWEPGAAQRWQEFLARHPEAGDSLDIIDDLITAMLVYPEGMSATLMFRGALPLLQRAGAIIQQAVEGRESAHLFWLHLENRPVLRCLVRLYLIIAYSLEDEDESERLFSWLLSLNPRDNHGMRAEAINLYLKRGQNEAAVKLAQRFPDDLLVDIRYGLVLALYRLNRARSAQQAAEAAISEFPLVAKYLIRSSVSRPCISPYGVEHGGKDQAWIYRETMREQWKATRGALAWLKNIR
jgi:tetratricopeptide (TPR) repeat protein